MPKYEMARKTKQNYFVPRIVAPNVVGVDVVVASLLHVRLQRRYQQCVNWRLSGLAQFDLSHIFY